MARRTLGIGGCSLYAPQHQVDLESWCGWTGASWAKTKEVVGYGFRMPATGENVYTMAATAVLRLIERYDVDAQRVGFLGLGTESSMDNAVGAVIVKGLVNQGLVALGRQPLPRSCEVPEFKQACLGGVYALKGAIRYVGMDGRGRQAIVVSSDIAAYQRGSSGEPTQGAGAVAQLVTEDPSLVTIDPEEWASASDYRALDFRKPALRYGHASFGGNGRVKDFPVFNGRYSTTCFWDEVRHAVAELGKRRGVSIGGLLTRASAIFTHRPYARLPLDSMALLYVLDWARDPERRDEFMAACRGADVDPKQPIEEAGRSFDLLSTALAGDVTVNPYVNIAKLVKRVRESGAFSQTVAAKLRFGVDTMAELGNLYTASLPAWLAAGLEEAARRKVDLAGRELLLVGYGSGNAAEALIMRPVEHWHEAALAMQITNDLGCGVRLSRDQYERLHGGGASLSESLSEGSDFEIARIGEALGEHFSDLGVEYYRFTRSSSGCAVGRRGEAVPEIAEDS